MNILDSSPLLCITYFILDDWWANFDFLVISWVRRRNFVINSLIFAYCIHLFTVVIIMNWLVGPRFNENKGIVRFVMNGFSGCTQQLSVTFPLALCSFLLPFTITIFMVWWNFTIGSVCSKRNCYSEFLFFLLTCHV